jgi:DNA-binding NarL/FixJ family response regulator
MMTESIGVLVVDDHVLFRDGIRTLLLGNEQMHLAGEADTGEQAIAQAEALQPDIVLMDIQLPGMNGIEAARQIVRASPHIAILMLTMFNDDQLVFSAMSAGARGYVLKGAAHDELLRAITAVANGEAIFSPGIATRMMSFFARMEDSNTRSIFPQLSEREHEILARIAHGESNADISRALNVSLKTIQNHVSNILNKLQVVDRAQAIVLAVKAGMKP